MTTLNLKCINPKELIEFIGRFKSIDANALLEINGTTNICIKSYIPTQTAVKVGCLDFSDIFEIVHDKMFVPSKLLIGIFNIDRFMKIFSNIDESAMEFIFEYEDYDDGSELFVDRFTIKSETLKINIPCGERILYGDMSDEIVDKVFDTETCVYQFKFEPKLLDKLLTLSSFEAGKNIEISVNTNKKGVKNLFFSGKNYNLKYQGEFTCELDTVKVLIDKEYFKYLDKDVYLVHGNEENLFFFSQDYKEMKAALGALVDN